MRDENAVISESRRIMLYDIAMSPFERTMWPGSIFHPFLITCDLAGSESSRYIPP